MVVNGLAGNEILPDITKMIVSCVLNKSASHQQFFSHIYHSVSNDYLIFAWLMAFNEMRNENSWFVEGL